MSAVKSPSSRSSSRSASSKTKNLTLFNLKSLERSKSARRPGVATITWGMLVNEIDWAVESIPPVTNSTRTCIPAPNSLLIKFWKNDKNSKKFELPGFFIPWFQIVPTTYNYASTIESSEKAYSKIIQLSEFISCFIRFFKNIKEKIEN